MNHRITLFTLALTFLAINPTFPQPYNPDSLLLRYHTTTLPDTTRLHALTNYLYYHLLYTHPDSAYQLAREMQVKATELQAKKFQATALAIQGEAAYQQAQFTTAIEHLQDAAYLFEQVHSIDGVARCNELMGSTFYYQGLYVQAIEKYQLALASYEQMPNEERMANALGNIGMLFHMQTDFEKAIEYYQRSLTVKQRIGSGNGVGITLNNLGLVSMEKGDYEMALAFFEQSLEADKDIQDLTQRSLAYANMGMVHRHLKHYDQSIRFLEESQALRQRVGDQQGVNECLLHLGWAYWGKGELQKALAYANQAMDLANQLDVMTSKAVANQVLYEIQKSRGQPEQALYHYQQYKLLHDSIQKAEDNQTILRKDMQYEFEKKEALHQADQEKQAIAHEAKVKRQELTIWSAGIGLLLVLLFSGFLYNRYKVTQRQRDVITGQKYLVDEKNRHITDSITYAQKIQEVILPSKEQLDQAFGVNQYFVLYQPKDIVSGDFYWLHHTSEYITWAVADCTGHGVPGAFMSMIGNSLLNEIVIEKGIQSPARILEELRKGIKQAMQQSAQAESRPDGMDIALCTWHKATNQLTFAAAYNPLYLVRGGTLQELKADRQPIGSYIKETPFTQQGIKLQKQDTLYLFSDGFYDQFGGDHNKKYGSKRFKTLLTDLHQHSPSQQAQRLATEAQRWRGEHEQIDDICIFGIKVT